MKVFITRYALTKGIQEIEAVEVSKGMIKAAPAPGSCYVSYYHGNDWHLTYEAAQLRAEAMVAKKLKTLRKQVAKLEKLSFSREDS